MSWSETKKINSDLNKPLNELILELLSAGVSVVKSVQRGTVTTSTSENRSISISPVDPSKSLLLVSGFGGGTYRGSITLSSDGTSIVQDKSVTGVQSVNGFDWQVIEYY